MIKVGDQVRLPSGSSFGHVTKVARGYVTVSFPMRSKPLVWEFRPACIVQGGLIRVDAALAKVIQIPKGSVLTTAAGGIDHGGQSIGNGAMRDALLRAGIL